MARALVWDLDFRRGEPDGSDRKQESHHSSVTVTVMEELGQTLNKFREAEVSSRAASQRIICQGSNTLKSVLEVFFINTTEKGPQSIC